MTIDSYHLRLADDLEEEVLTAPLFPVPTSKYDFEAIEEAGLALMRCKSPLAPPVLAWCLKAKALVH